MFLSKVLSTSCTLSANSENVDPLISCPDSQTVEYILSYPSSSTNSKFRPVSEQYSYDKTYQSWSDFLNYSYAVDVEPLVKKVIESENALIMFGGTKSVIFNHYLLSSDNQKGILHEAATDLLHAVHSRENTKTGSVTFSWLKVECTENELLIDVLKSASMEGQAAECNNLILREIGKGRGMMIPGLWEVEISSGQDVEAVVNHVLSIHEDSEQIPGSFHTIMQLTVSQKITPNSSGSSVSSSSVKMGGNLDPPGVGRLTFVMLSNLSPQHHTRTASTISPLTSSISLSESEYYPWYTKLLTILDRIEDMRSSLPFHKSRIGLFLRDVICGRQFASFIFLLDLDPVYHKVNRLWLQLSNRLNKYQNHEQQKVIEDGNSPHETIFEIPKDITKRQNASMTSQPFSHSMATLDTTNSYTDFNYHSEVQLRSSKSRSSTPTSIRTGGFTISRNVEPDLEFSNGHWIDPMKPVSQNRQSTDDSSVELQTPMTSFRPNPTNRIVSNESRASSAQRVDKRKQRGMNPRDPYRKETIGEIDNIVLESVREEKLQHEVTDLKRSLDASQKEIASLRTACKVAGEKYEELQHVYNSLVSQLKEEGAMLERRDREKYRSTLKDLKDYEVYKSVMEAAMVRIQSELESLIRENKELKENQTNEIKQMKKQKNFSERYSRDLTMTRRKFEESEQKISKLEKELKQSNRDRDVAMATISQVKYSENQKEAELRSQLNAKISEGIEFQKRIQLLETSVSELQMDKESILANSDKEVTTLRAAHSKALEMLMGYQEENDMLRNAITQHNQKYGQMMGNSNGTFSSS